MREAFRYIDLQSLGWELNTDRIHLRVEWSHPPDPHT